MEEKLRAHIIVSGRVQGVYFRENARRKAEKLGVFGWIMNLPDGTVEAVFEGEKDNVIQIVEWMKKGPVFAKVEDINVWFEEFKDEFKNFQIRY